MAHQTPLDIAFLGTGNALAQSRCWSGFLLNRRYLFDTPPTALLSLNRLSADLAAIDTIFISHFHGDHFFGLPFLFLDFAHRTQRRDDLTLIGPPGLEERVERLMEIGYPRTFGHQAGYSRRYVEVGDGAEGELNELSFRAVGVEHGEGAMPCLGFRVAVGGRTLSYTGDTAWCDGLLALADDVEVLVSDCTYTEGRRHPAQHLSLDEIGDLRQQIDPRTRVILTHLGGPITDRGLDRVYVASDLATFSFP